MYMQDQVGSGFKESYEHLNICSVSFRALVGHSILPVKWYKYMFIGRENASQVCINKIYGCKTFLDVVIVECQSSSEMVGHVSDPFLWGKEREKIGG